MTSERHFLVVVENFKVIYSPHVEMIRKYQTNVITVNSTADPFIFFFIWASGTAALIRASDVISII